jgi:type IV fimbrial biogenesis protein FimT
MSKTPGFTLIELMVALSVATILLTVGIPSYQDFIQKYRINTQTNRLIGALRLARSEAIKGDGKLVILCKLDTAGTGCNSTGSWSDGWLLYQDMNADKNYSASTDRLIQTYEKTQYLTITTGNNYRCWIGFGANGYTIGGGTDCRGNALGNDSIKICPAAANSGIKGTSIIINNIGRIRTDDATC